MVLETADGGDTWVVRFSAAPQSRQLPYFYGLAMTPQRFFAVGTDGVLPVVVSGDRSGGAVKSAPLGSEPGRVLAVVVAGDSVWLAGERGGATTRALLFESSDSGVTWAERTATQLGGIMDLQMPSPIDGTLLDVRGMHGTKDGWKSIERIELPIEATQRGVRRLFFVSPAQAFAIGPAGFLSNQRCGG